MGHAVILMLSVQDRGFPSGTTYVEERRDQVNTKGRNGSGNEGANRRGEERLDNLCLSLILQLRRDACKCGAGQPERADEKVQRNERIHPGY